MHHRNQIVGSSRVVGDDASEKNAGDGQMHPNLGIKSTRKTREDRNEPFSLAGTLDQYEVEELDAREIADLLTERRRRKGRRIASETL